MSNSKKLLPKLKIRKRVFLGEFKIEDYLQKEVEKLTFSKGYKHEK
jgi:hypothetical protein